MSETSPSVPVLSIGVPTYNRPGLLPRLLDGIVRQAVAIGAEASIELVVCDNSSASDTELAIAPWRAGPVAVRYGRNERNLGMVRNILKTLERSRGAYWMLYGDDDEMPDGALAAILAELSVDAPPPVAVFRGEPCIPAYDFTQRELLSTDETVRRLFYYMGNGGRLAISRDLACEAMAALGDHRWTCWPQTEVALVSLVLSREERPVVLSPATTVLVHHDENAVYTAYHLAETPTLSLLRAAHNVAPWIGVPARADAERFLLAPDRFRGYLVPIVMRKTLSDLPEDVAAFRAVTTQTLVRDSTPRSFPRLLALWFLAHTPRWLDRLLVGAYAIARHRGRWRAVLAEWAERYSRGARIAAAAGAPDSPRAHTRDDLTW